MQSLHRQLMETCPQYNIFHVHKKSYKLIIKFINYFIKVNNYLINISQLSLFQQASPGSALYSICALQLCEILSIMTSFYLQFEMKADALIKELETSKTVMEANTTEMRAMQEEVRILS